MGFWGKGAEWSKREDDLQDAYDKAEDRGANKDIKKASDAILKHHENRPAADRLRHPVPGYKRG